MQYKNTNHHTQATGTVGCYSQHDTTMQWNPLKAIVSFYQEISQ